MPDEPPPRFRPLLPPPWDALAPLIAESETEGFRFLLPLRADYDAGRVRFDGPGEALLGVYAGDELIAIGGLTIDPYVGDPRTGRVRRVYVRPAHRRRGVGGRLLAALEAAARPHFDVLLLRTDTAAAARFYERLGYAPLAPGGTATHRRVLRADAGRRV
jgi:GNAT superfamily N-acetyltransferase